ncbi:c-type cytochrome, partial [Flavobacterium sp. UBA4854]
MKKTFLIGLFSALSIAVFNSCTKSNSQTLASKTTEEKEDEEGYITIDTSKIPDDQFGESVRYGRELMMKTAYYIGPNGKNGQYLGNKMNCTNCHQDAGTKPHAFNLMSSHDNYPQYRGRENKVLTLAERVNNCIMRPHSGKPLPLD